MRERPYTLPQCVQQAIPRTCRRLSRRCYVKNMFACLCMRCYASSVVLPSIYTTRVSRSWGGPRGGGKPVACGGGTTLLCDSSFLFKTNFSSFKIIFFDNATSTLSRNTTAIDYIYIYIHHDSPWLVDRN